MELAAQEEWIAGNFDNLDISCIGSGAAQPQATTSQQRFVLAVELVAMAMPLADLCSAVGAGGERTLLQDAGPRAQPHGPAHLLNAQQFTQLVDDAVLAGGIKLAGVGVLQAADVAGKLDTGGLHAHGNSDVRHLP